MKQAAVQAWGGGIYDNSTTNPGGGDTENPGGEEDKPGVTPVNEFPANPLALLGIYNVINQTVDGTAQEVTAGSEFRVNVDTSRLTTSYVDVLVRIKVNGKTIEFQREVSLAGQQLGADFFEKIFTEMGAKVTGKYTLEFTLASEAYNELVAEGIIIDGQTLVLSLDKTKDLVMDSGLDDNTEEPEEPEEPVVVPVDSVTIKGQPANVVHGGASFQLTAEVLPNDATNKEVTWSSSHPDYISVDNQGNVTIKGYTAETITITATSTADNTKTASWQFNIEKATVTAISVNPNPLMLALRNDDTIITGTLTTSITPSIAAEYTTISYTSNNTDIVTVDNKGVVTAVTAGDTTITVTVGSITETVNVTVEAPPVLTVPVTGIEVTSVSKVYKKGSDIQVSFKLLPENTTDKSVNYSTPSGISGSVTAVDGIGTITLAGVQTSETLTVTTLLNHTAAYEIQVVDGVDSISFENNKVTKEQNTVFTNNIVNYDAISNSIASWTYSSDDANIASVDPVTGQVTANKNGVTMIRVTAQPKYDAEPLHAEFKIDVLGHIDYTDETSLQGTYDIIFFATNSNGKKIFGPADSRAIITTDCEIYKSLWISDSCTTGGLGDFLLTNHEEFAGRAIIKVSEGVLKVHTKVAMLFTGMNNTAASAAANDRYQYSVYGDKSLSGWLDSNVIGSMPGRNLSEPTNLKNPKYAFENKKDYNGYSDLDIVLFSHFEGKSTALGDVNPDTRLVLRKISSQVTTMDPNTLTEAPFDKLNGKLSLKESGNINISFE